MFCLFDTDAYVVVHMRLGTRRAGAGITNMFEIVDKKIEASVLLHGDSSVAFQTKIKEWQENVPTQAQVENVLARFTQLGRIPLRRH
jgi:hypothetical protein